MSVYIPRRGVGTIPVPPTPRPVQTVPPPDANPPEPQVLQQAAPLQPPPLAPENLVSQPAPAPPGPAAPPWPPPRKQYQGYAGILAARVDQHIKERPGMNLGLDEVADTVRQVKESTPLGERSRLFRQTGLTTAERVKQDLIGVFQAQHKLENEQAAEKDAAMAQINTSRVAQGLPPLGGVYNSPEVAAAMMPLRDKWAADKALADTQKQVATRREKMRQFGIGEGHTLDDRLAYEEGRLTDITKIRPIPDIERFKTETVGGVKFIKAPPGYSAVKPGKAVQSPGDKANDATNKADLMAIRKDRGDIATGLTELEGEVRANDEYLAEMEAQDAADAAKAADPNTPYEAPTPGALEAKTKAAEERRKLALSTRVAKSKMRALTERDMRLAAQEDEMRGTMGSTRKAAPGDYITGEGGTRQRVALPAELEPHVTEEKLTGTTTKAYIMKLARQYNLTRKQISVLLAQHPELDSEDLSMAEKWMTTQGVE